MSSAIPLWTRQQDTLRSSLSLWPSLPSKEPRNLSAHVYDNPNTGRSCADTHSWLEPIPEVGITGMNCCRGLLGWGRIGGDKMAKGEEHRLGATIAWASEACFSDRRLKVLNLCCSRSRSTETKQQNAPRVAIDRLTGDPTRMATGSECSSCAHSAPDAKP